MKKYTGVLPSSRIPEQYEKDLRDRAEQFGLSVAAIARFALQRYLYGDKVPGAAPVSCDANGHPTPEATP
jgi:hypothetical protein